MLVPIMSIAGVLFSGGRACTLGAASISTRAANTMALTSLLLTSAGMITAVLLFPERPTMLAASYALSQFGSFAIAVRHINGALRIQTSQKAMNAS